MTAWQPLPSVARFTQLLQAVTKLRHYSCSVKLFQRMNALGVPVDARTTSIVIQCLCQMNCTRKGFAVLGYGYKRAVVPDVFILSTLLDGLILENKVPQAETFFKKLVKDKVCQPNAVMYTNMIKVLCEFGDNDAAIALLKQMGKTNVVAYGTIIESLCKKQKVDEALKFFRELVFHKGLKPDVVTYISLLHGLRDLSRRDDLYKLYIELEDNYCLDVEIQSIFVDVYCKLGRMRDAENIVKLIPYPGVDIYESLIGGYRLVGEMSKARQCTDSLRSISIGVGTYNMLLISLFFKDDYNVEEAIRLFHEMIERGLKPTLVTYHIMLEGLFKVGHWPHGRKLFNEMLAGDVQPNGLTYTIVLKGLCDNNKVDEALSMFHSMGDHKLNPNIDIYNILIDAESKSGKIDTARNLFYDLTIKGLQPDATTYVAMINCFCLEGRVVEARRYFLEMKVKGIRPHCLTNGYQLFKGVLKNKQLDIAETLI